MDFDQTYSYIVETRTRTDKILVTITPFLRSRGWGAGGGSDYLKMACLHPISRMNGWILTKLVHLYCCDMEKN